MRNEFKVEGDVVVVELTRGKSMRVAVWTLPLLAPYRWWPRRGRAPFGLPATWYASTTVLCPDGRRRELYAHRLIMGLGFGDRRQIDHLDWDGLNCVHSNMRVTDNAGNAFNRRGKARRSDGREPTSRLPGVYWDRTKSKWRAQIKSGGRNITLGRFASEVDAGAAYLRAKVVRDAGGGREKIRAAAQTDRRFA
jgi:hypothetical protein